jgi:hypothetical protein
MTSVLVAVVKFVVVNSSRSFCPRVDDEVAATAVDDIEQAANQKQTPPRNEPLRNQYNP